jgi:hypothetical protein
VPFSVIRGRPFAPPRYIEAMQPLALTLLPYRLAICRLAPGAAIPAWATAGPFFSITRTPDELSIICEPTAVPAGVRHESGCRAFKVAGPLDFALTGVLTSIAKALAEAGISIFALSTFDTDYVLMKNERVEDAVRALEAAGHQVNQ